MLLTTFRSLRLFASALLVTCLLAPSPHAGELRVGGTGAATELLRTLGGAFAKESEAEVEVIAGLGSSGGMRALSEQVLDLAVSGRPLKPEEMAQGLTVALIARTPFVLASSHPKPNALKLADVVEAFSSPKTAWADGTPIRIVLRPKSDSDTAVMGALFPGLASAIEGARKRPDVPVAANDQDNADMGEQIPGSLIGATLTQIVAEKRKLRAIAIDGIEPTFANFESGTYRYERKLYFVVSSTPSPLAQRFVDFLHSPEGREVLRRALILL